MDPLGQAHGFITPGKNLREYTCLSLEMFGLNVFFK